jgi:hypothetical protein
MVWVPLVVMSPLRLNDGNFSHRLTTDVKKIF